MVPSKSRMRVVSMMVISSVAGYLYLTGGWWGEGSAVPASLPIIQDSPSRFWEGVAANRALRLAMEISACARPGQGGMVPADAPPHVTIGRCRRRPKVLGWRRSGRAEFEHRKARFPMRSHSILSFTRQLFSHHLGKRLGIRCRL